MPEALASWIDNRDILSVGRIQATILQTYSDDFAKYRNRIEPELLRLLLLRNPWEKPELYYWQRDKKGSSAEVDYLFNLGTRIIPMEVKAGKTGTIRSLHTFMGTKQAVLGVRFYCNLPSVDSIDTTIQRIGRARYTLISLPLYMVSETERILQEYL